MNNHGEETKPVTITRRKAVKTIVGGVTAVAAYNILPATWNTPIIESIFIPAHAATSGTSLSDPCEVTWVSGYQDSSTVVVDITGYVTPPTANLPTTIVATGNPDADATATITTTTAADGTFSGTATLTTSSGIGTVLVTTIVEGASGEASCRVDVPQRWDQPEGDQSEGSCCDEGGASGTIRINNILTGITIGYTKCGDTGPTVMEDLNFDLLLADIDITKPITASSTGLGGVRLSDENNVSAEGGSNGDIITINIQSCDEFSFTVWDVI